MKLRPPNCLFRLGLAEQLDLWPPRGAIEESEFDTAGGPLRVWIFPRACRVTVIAEDANPPIIDVDIVVSPLADEVLMSDKVISELQIALEDVGRGYWRFQWEPKERLRRSEPPRYWR